MYDRMDAGPSPELQAQIDELKDTVDKLQSRRVRSRHLFAHILAFTSAATPFETGLMGTGRSIVFLPVSARFLVFPFPSSRVPDVQRDVF